MGNFRFASACVGNHVFHEPRTIWLSDHPHSGALVTTTLRTMNLGLKVAMSVLLAISLCSLMALRVFCSIITCKDPTTTNRKLKTHNPQFAQSLLIDTVGNLLMTTEWDSSSCPCSPLWRWGLGMVAGCMTGTDGVAG